MNNNWSRCCLFRRELLTRYCGKLKIIFLPQVLNLEDELVRCTDARTAMELTKSGSVKNFKTDFCKMKTKDCRSMLERHKLDYARLWMTKTPEAFSFVENNSSQIKTLWSLMPRWETNEVFFYPNPAVQRTTSPIWFTKALILRRCSIWQVMRTAKRLWTSMQRSSIIKLRN